MKVNQIAFQGEKGFTVVEIAIVLLISGFMFTIFLGLYQSFKSQRAYNETIENMVEVDKVLQEFYSNNGRFPCPADPTLPPGHADYGVELTCGSAASGWSGECSPGTRPTLSDGVTPSNVICTNVGTRDVNNDGVNEYALIGILPFTTLAEDTGLLNIFSEYTSRDGYTMRMTYSVTEVMADWARVPSDPANLNNGAISIYDENGRSLTDPESNVYYTIVSHGENQKGAYNDQGNRTENCVLSSTYVEPTPGLNDPNDPVFGGEIDMENENCDNNDGIFRSALKSSAISESYFDDIVYYRNIIESGIWTLASNIPAPPTTMNYYVNTNVGNAGVGTLNPTSKLHVSGDIIADQAAFSEEGYCDTTRPSANPADSPADGAARCFQPSLIAGQGDECTGGEVAIGFAQNELDCEPLFRSGVTYGPPCVAPEFARGINYNRDTNTITYLCAP